jgi:flagellar motor switch protein FliM
MADSFLSQEEVDALFKGVDEEPEDSAPSAVPCDLATQERVVRGRLPNLEVINKLFVSLLRADMASYLHCTVLTSVDEPRRSKYCDFIGGLGAPTSLNLVRLKPLRGTALIVLDPDLVFLIVDKMFGGDGRFHSRIKGREFTHTEQRIIGRVLEQIMKSYARAWAPVFPIEVEHVRSESSTHLANVAMPNDLVIETTVSMVLGPVTGEMHVCMPYSMIEPIRHVLCNVSKERSPEGGRDWAPLIADRLQGAEVELVAHLGDAPVTLRDILNMKLGDVIPLNVRQIVAAKVDDVQVMDCSYGTLNGRYALRVERLLTRSTKELVPGDFHA